MHSPQVMLTIATVFSVTGAVHLHPIKSILNASSCHIVKKQKYNHISWQQFKMNCSGYQCSKDVFINYATSSTSAFIRLHHYIHHQCVYVGEIDGRHHLHLAVRGDLVVPCITNKTYGLCSFAVWNSLLMAAIDLELTLQVFNKLLNTELFRRAYTTS